MPETSGISMVKASLNEAGYIDLEKVEELAHIIRSMALRQDNYVDQRFYPAPELDVDLQIMFFAAMVSIDHRLTMPGVSYEEDVDGVHYRGADLLWLRGKQLLDRDPDSFSPRRLASVSPAWVREWLGDIWDYGIRAFLLQDLGIKMELLYGGSPRNFIKRSGNYLRNGGHGFVELLSAFAAFTDPVEKKAMLLAKFLHGRGLVKFLDVHNEEVPVDNHLTRIAVRLGLVEPSREYMDMILKSIPFAPRQDIAIRILVRHGWKLVSMLGDVEPFALDDFLWSFGRTTCTVDHPKCANCPFRDACRLRESHPREHVFNVTYWY